MPYLLQSLLNPSANPIPGLGDIKEGEAGLFSNPIIAAVIIALLSIFVLIIIAYISRYFFSKRKKLPAALRRVVLLITLPKETSTEEKQQAERPIEELLGEAEALFSSLGGMKAQRGAGTFFKGRYDNFSMEIVAHKGLISFYIVVPKYLRSYMEQHIHAQYPKANIEEVEEYNVFSPKSQIAATTLMFKKSYIFPIKTYRQSDVDPLNSLTNILSKVDKDDGVVIQYIVRSAKAQWHNWGARVAREMHEGKSVNEAIGRHGLTGFLFTIFRIFFPKKKEDEEERLLRAPVQLAPRDEEISKSLEEKTSKAGMDVNIRIIVSSKTMSEAQSHLKEITDSFSQYTLYEYGNGFVRKDPFNKNKLLINYIYRTFDAKRKLVLNTEEMASLYHFPLPTTETPNIRWLMARKSSAPVNIPQEGLLLGENRYRGKKKEIRIKKEDRRRHVYTIGMTGVGKSVLMMEMAKQDIQNGEGVCVVDPHGGLVEDILSCIPRERVEDVIVFDPSDTKRPVGLNMLDAKTPEEADFAAQEMIAIFYKLFPPEMIGPMFEHNMRNVMLTLIADKEYPGTIADIPRMFTDKNYQDYKLKKVTDPVVRAFWEKEMAKTSDFHKSEMLGYLISKVGRFVENKMMRNIIGQPHSGFNFREIMDKQKILLVNLSKGKTGEVNSSLLGLIIVSKLQMAALGRADLPESERKDFYLYIDEFQNFITDSIATILSEARKYRLNLTLAHQYLGQLVEKGDTKIRDAVLGNVGTIIAFRIGVEDAEIMAKQFEPVFSEYDLVNISRFNAYVKLLIDNSISKAFNMATFPPTEGDKRTAEYIKGLSRQKYGRDQRIVEAEILERTRLGEPVKTERPPIG